MHPLDEAENLLLYLNEERNLTEVEAHRVTWLAGALILANGDPELAGLILETAMQAIKLPR